MNRILLVFFACALSIQWALAQGTTTASLNGEVRDATGEAIPGANITAVHQPTGSEYISVSNVDGLFRISNMKVGGPYTITVTFVGFKDFVQKNISLDLGQTYQINPVLSESVTELVDVIVTAGGLIDGNRTGSETTIGEEQIMSLPTVDRSLTDFTRLTPQANLTPGGGLSIAGVNNRYNAIYIDGAVNNDVFGLANSGTNGGQAGISPISVDALEQIQVVVAPYDVTLGGFAGGGINAVTRSGKNYFEGSAYYYFRNEKLSGKTPGDLPDDERTRLDPFSSKLYGFRLGGPIVKNKLFFFVNGEIQREETPLPFTFNGYRGDANEAKINELVSFLDSEYGYDPGGYKNNVRSLDGEKFLVRLDWNINANHKLTARHSYTRGEAIVQDRPNSGAIYFYNTGYVFPTTTNSTALELKSNFGNKFSNNLILGLTTVFDDRNLLGAPFPRVEAQDGNATVYFGTDAFTYSNIVDQDVFTLTDNFNLYAGRHTFTFGTHNEFFKILNLFTIFSTPQYSFNNGGGMTGLEHFLNGDAALSLFGHELPANQGEEVRLGDDADNLAADFSAMQLAFYAQDEFQVNNQLKLTFGLRADIPLFLDDAPQINTQFNNQTIPMLEAVGYDLKGAQASRLPKTSVLWSPRLGFNFDLKGDKATQLRGGLGIFTSRIPWVWPGGIYIRNGLTSSFAVNFAPFQPTPADWRANLINLTKPSGDVDLFTEDFKYPQVFRTSIGIDQKLPWGLIGTVEFMYTKTLNNIDLKNLNQVPSTENLEGADNRPLFSGASVDSTYGRITLVDNTNKGYTWNVTAQIQKPFSNGLTGSLAYSFTRAETLFDGQGFINSTSWRDHHSIMGRNNPMMGRSALDVGSRITGFLSYRKEYLNNFATTVTLVYTGQSGVPYSYVYRDGGGVNNEDTDERNLLYVPASLDEITFGSSEAVAKDENNEDIFGGVPFSQEQQAAMYAELKEFIDSDEYLGTQQGQYAERNMSRLPFESVFDLKVQQDFFITTANGRRHTLQVSLDIFNFSNLLNKEWGARYVISDSEDENNNNFRLLNFEGFEYENGTFTNRPVFSFQNPGEVWDLEQSGISSARWSAQLGVRYLF